jgi:hypothetical protein
MMQITISLRALVLVLLLGMVVFTGSDVAHGAPSAAELIGDGLLMTNPGQNGARDIHTDSSTSGGNNLGGVRIYAGNTLTNPPTTAALQFYGNGHTGSPGQAFIDSGANNNAAIIFRTAPAGQGVAERMRITSDGKIGIGTQFPSSAAAVTVRATAGTAISAVTLDSTSTGIAIDGSADGANTSGVTGSNFSKGRGVTGLSDSGDGAYGSSNSLNGVHGVTQSGWAGYFEGNVKVTGQIQNNS